MESDAPWTDGGESGQATPYAKGGGYRGAHRGRGRHPASAGRDIGGQEAASRYGGYLPDGRIVDDRAGRDG